MKETRNIPISENIGARGNFLNFLDLRRGGSGGSQPDSPLTYGVCEIARALSPKELCRGLRVQPKTPGLLLSTGSPRSPTGSPQPFDEFDRLIRVAEHAFPSSESVVNVVERAFNEDSRAPRHPLPSPLMTTTTKFRKFPLAPIVNSSSMSDRSARWHRCSSPSDSCGSTANTPSTSPASGSFGCKPTAETGSSSSNHQ